MVLLEFANIEEQFAKDKQLKREDVAKLEEWQLMQPHLPSPLHPIEAALFLHSCYYSNEAAKQCIDTYYTFRSQYPDFFVKRDPYNQELQIGLNTLVVTMLPDLTAEGYIVVYGQLHDRNPNVFNHVTLWKIVDMLFCITIKQRGCFNGVVAVINLEGTTLSHLLKVNLIALKNAFEYLQTGIAVRLKSIHFVNSVSFMDKLLSMIKPFLGIDYKELLKVHYGSNETIFKYVPKSILPIECGGESFYATDIYRNVTRKEIERHAEYFKVEELQIADESKRLDKPKDLVGLSEIQGTFKKLELD